MNTRRHIFTAVCLLCAALFTLNGCSSVGLSPDGMMKPPKAAGDGGDIQEAITALLSAQITLRYPRSGENRSAVVRADIDGDDTAEAVAFYRLAPESSGAHMIVLDEIDGEWEKVGEAGGEGGEIDRVMFGDLDGNGTLDIITGWSFFSGANCVISAHTLSDGVLTALPAYEYSADGTKVNASYTEMVTGDFDGDGRDDIITVLLNNQTAASTAAMLRIQQAGTPEACLSTVYSIELDGSVIEYINAQAGSITETIDGLILDGYRADGTCSTELVYWNGSTSQLVSPLNAADNTHEALFTRSQRIASADVNDDGIIELPKDTPMGGFEPGDSDIQYLTTWHCYLSGTATHEQKAMLLCGDLGYCVNFSDIWRDRVTVRVDPLDRDIVYFYEYTGGRVGDEIMRIRAFTPAEWEEESSWEPHNVIAGSDSPRYRELASNGYYVFSVLTTSVQSAYFSYADIRAAFEFWE